MRPRGARCGYHHLRRRRRIRERTSGNHPLRCSGWGTPRGAGDLYQGLSSDGGVRMAQAFPANTFMRRSTPPCGGSKPTASTSTKRTATTPLIETMQALADVVRAGKALYIGVSEWTAEQAREAHALHGISASRWSPTSRDTTLCTASSKLKWCRPVRS
jgi:Aldo/keto reductase family